MTGVAVGVRGSRGTVATQAAAAGNDLPTTRAMHAVIYGNNARL